MVAMGFDQRVLSGSVEIGGDHFGAHLLDCDFRHPSEFVLGLGGITQQGFDRWQSFRPAILVIA